MAIDKTKIREFPPISITIDGEDGGELLIGATRQAVTGTDETEVRRALMGLVVAHARTGGSPVRVTTRDQDGIGVLLVSPEGEIEEEYAESLDDVMEPVPAGAVPARLTPTAPREERPAPEPVAQPEVTDSFNSIVKNLEEPASEPGTAAPAAEPLVTVPAQVKAPEELPSRKSLRDSQSFLAVHDHIAPARKGWQGRVNGFGLRLAPGDVELAEREDEHLVARTYPGPRVIGVVNQKGGAAKTPGAVNLSAVFGRAGLSVCTWDNNESTGTLAMRVDRSDHGSSALHVIAGAKHLLSDTARAADIGGFVHRQTVDKFDALFSDQDIDGLHEITADEVDVIHSVLTKYYNLIVMDSGNNHRAANWQRMIDFTDQLVVPMTTAEDRVESARLTLQGLARRDDRSARLTENAVVIVSEEQEGRQRAAQLHADKFRDYVREVVIIPFDPALKDGVIRHDALRPATQRAWLSAAAAVAKGL
ncbi:MinD/ParA family ATP-binding protein [Arthrobacter bambusae]|uniref:MinD/ParA family ATP-binding protein n=1 Tax=Arthrobacter bambusae TaxID=1338426 RepID=UPI00278860AF|nr:chromosome partitioning protein ParA [Arthrobacter bambusae]MDQ0241467.1 MinD-like ATPase involved in chromosome partitioning or flagellar assembly [Arthrobacter bambusae]